MYEGVRASSALLYTLTPRTTYQFINIKDRGEETEGETETKRESEINRQANRQTKTEPYAESERENRRETEI